MPSITRRPLAAALACALLGGALLGTPLATRAQVDNLPRLGDAGGEELSPATERRIGETIMRDLRREREVLDDVEVVEYVNRFASVLAETPAASGFQLEFFVVKDPTLNAFAMPGGFIGVHTGLLLAAQSESELASVLSHEIGHVTQRHIARMLAQQKQTSVLSLAALVLSALAVKSSPQGAAGFVALGGGIQQQMMLGFSRDAEREADRVGISILRQANFDPSGMVSFFGRLQKASGPYESNAPAYIRTHPLTSERIADIQARIREGRYRQHADSPDFNLVRAKLRVLADPGVDGLRSVRSQFERQLRDRATLDEAAAWYGIGVAATMQRDFPAAERAIAEARKRLPAGNAIVEHLAVEERLAAGDARGALELAEAATARFPAARALVHSRAAALLALGENERAVRYLDDQTQTYRSDPELWRMLGQAYDRTGKTALAHRASAEQYALLGGWLAAIEQLKLAQRSGKLDFYTASEVDVRVKELQAQYTREQQDRKTP